LAFLEIEQEDPMDPEQAELEEEFDEEIAMAAVGDWDALGIEPPPAAPADRFEPVSVAEFLATAGGEPPRAG
jgi:hypothetical protein